MVVVGQLGQCPSECTKSAQASFFCLHLLFQCSSEFLVWTPFEDRSQVMRIRTELRIWWPKFHHLRPFPEIWEYRSHSESHCKSHLSILSLLSLLLSFYRFYLGAQRGVFKDTGCWVDHLFEAALIPNGHEANVWPAVKSTEQKDSNVTWQKHSGKQVTGSCRKLLKPCTTCHLSSICHPKVSKSSGLAWLWANKSHRSARRCWIPAWDRLKARKMGKLSTKNHNGASERNAFLYVPSLSKIQTSTSQVTANPSMTCGSTVP